MEKTRNDWDAYHAAPMGTLGEMMPSPTPPTRFWSDALGWNLLSSLPPEELAEQWGLLCASPNGAVDGSPTHLRQELLAWAQQDGEVRRWIVHAWREAHPDVVTATDQVLTEGLTLTNVRRLEGFPVEEVLLALLTDEFDDGPEQAHAFVNSVRGESQRHALLSVLQRLLGKREVASRRLQARVVILGGHRRDESRLDQRLFARSPFAVRWKTFEKKASGGVLHKAVVTVLRHADAALIITGMASHALMHYAKEYAERSGLPWRCLTKATDKQLKAALHELFPELTIAWK